MLVFGPGELKSIPPSELHLLTGPGLHGDILVELRDSVRAYHQHPDQSVIIRPSPGARLIFDACSMAAELGGESAEISRKRSRHIREAQASSSGREQAYSGGPTKSTRQSATKIREAMDSGRSLNILGQSDLSFPCFGSCFKCWGPLLRPQYGSLLPTFGTRSSQVGLRLPGWGDLSHVSPVPRQRVPAQ